MAHLYDTACSSSSSAPEPDEISLFLHQILLRSSSSTSSLPKQIPSSAPSHVQLENQQLQVNATSILAPEWISVGGPVIPSLGFAGSPANVSSSSVGTIDNDLDDYDCESEEGFENMVDETAAKPNPPRNSSKRSRAAEVHNLSEKRRRSRINEKIKTLQKLIPNSNKTDKASMLDEAIEYLKQLQLQVQMLTMRNGLSLYPMCGPVVLPSSQLSQTRMDFNEGNGSLNPAMTGTLSGNHETITNPTYCLPIQSTNQSHPSMSHLSDVLNPEISFRQDSSVLAQPGSFQFHRSSKEVCREGLMDRPKVEVDPTLVNSTACHVEKDTQLRERKGRRQNQGCSHRF